MFKTTANKDYLREQIDKKQIVHFFNKKCKKLRYIGLPGEELHDIEYWKDYLGEIIAVEVGEHKHPDTLQNRMYLRAFELGVMDRFSVLEGELDDILISGEDIHKNKLKYPFDLANFDYCGSVLYSGFKRIDSIKTFIENQIGNSFLLLHSSRIKEKEEIEILNSLNSIKTELIASHSQQDIKKKIEEFFEQLIKNKDILYKFLREKLFNLYFLKLYAESKGYKVEFRKPIVYKGFKEHILMRFITFFIYSGKTTTRVVSQQSILDIINMPILSLNEKRILFKIKNPMGNLIL